jgi:hypothetical protein
MAMSPVSLVLGQGASNLSKISSSTTTPFWNPLLGTTLSLRGGQVAATVAATATATDGVLDLARTIRLESINSYSIVAALLLQATLRLYSDTPKDLIEDEEEEDGNNKSSKNNHKRDNLVKILFVTSAGLSIICGAYIQPSYFCYWACIPKVHWGWAKTLPF